MTAIPEGFVPKATVPEGFKKEKRTTPEKVGRGVALGARHLVETPALAFAGGGDLLSKGINVGLELAGADYRIPENRVETIEEGFTQMGFPEAETGPERVVQGVNRAVVGAALPIKTGSALGASANPVTARVGTALADSPALQGVSAATGAGASEAVRESGGSTGEQLVAGLAGGLTPSLVKTATSSTVRGAVRGGESGRQTVADNVETFERAGTTPTVGQATEGRAQQATESLLSKVPGGAGPIANKVSSQADDLAKSIQQRADELVPNADPAKAGRAIEDGIKNGFIGRFRETTSKLYDDIDQHLDTAKPVSAKHTKGYLEKASTPIEGATETSKILSNQFLDELGLALTEDLQVALENTGTEGLPYEALKQLRTKVGDKLGNLSLVSDVSKGQLKQLYGALSRDLTDAAREAGPDALSAARRANRFYRAGQARIDLIESVIKKKGGPEKIFQAAVSGTKEGATTLRAVYKSLDTEQRKTLTAAMVRRLGKATSSRQNDQVDRFSIETFLTGWANLSPEARSTLFGRLGKKFAADMDAITSVASNIRDGSGVFRNASGTAASNLQEATAVRNSSISGNRKTRNGGRNTDRCRWF